jgi:glycosyltransferase involved in cell wall biosynthesis
MRIVQFITPSQIGGAEVHVLSLAARLRRRGHEVTVVCPRGRALERELRARGLPLWAPRTTGKFDPATLLRLAGRLRRWRADVLHTHLSTASLLGSLAARLVGVPAIATVHGLNTRTCFRFAGRLIAVSQAVKQHLVAQGVPADRIRVIYNGIDLPLGPKAARRDLAAGMMRLSQAVVVGTVGRLGPEKGHRYLLEAVAELARRRELPPIQVLIVGEGRELVALRALAARLGIAERVTFAGFQRDVWPYLAAMDVFVLPSLKEGLSLSALEAMALGKPVVASRVGGTPEVVEDGVTGMLGPPRDGSALAEALASLLGRRQAMAEMGKAGRQRVAERFDAERMANQIEHLYREAAEGATPRPAP